MSYAWTKMGVERPCRSVRAVHFEGGIRWYLLRSCMRCCFATKRILYAYHILCMSACIQQSKQIEHCRRSARFHRRSAEQSGQSHTLAALANSSSFVQLLLSFIWLELVRSSYHCRFEVSDLIVVS